MIDQFGIGKVLEITAMTYTQTARRTGRTTQMIAGLKDGDRVVFNNKAEAERVRRLCLEQGLKINCLVVEAKSFDRLIEKGKCEGDTVFDHSWLEEYYLVQTREAQAMLQTIADRLKSPPAYEIKEFKPWSGDM